MAVKLTVIAVYSLLMASIVVTCLQRTAAIKSKIGLIKFDPRGVEAAKTTSPTSRPTSRQTASGPLVIKPVNVPILLVFLRHSMSISMAKPRQSMSNTIPTAPIEAKRTSPAKSRALPIKKIRTRAQAARSRIPRELERNFFKIQINEGESKVRSAFVLVDKVGNISSVYKQCTKDLVVDFECRDHSYPVIPALSRCSSHIDYFHAYFWVVRGNLKEILLCKITPRTKR